MKKPSLEEVKEYFKNAETVKCLSDNDVYYINFENEIENAWDYGIYLNDCKDLKGSVDQCMLWKKGQGYAEILTHKEPKEETFVISKEQISRLYDMADIQKMTLFKDEIKLLFPSAFVEDKKELILEAGRWYKSGDTIFNHQEAGNSYGILRGKWQQNNWTTRKEYFSCPILEMTPEEVKEALKAEAVKRGYKDGVFMEGLYFGDKEAYKCSGNDFDYEEIPFQVLKGKMGLRDKVGNVIFCDGVWAEIIQPKKMTQAEIEKELGYNIEIV